MILAQPVFHDPCPCVFYIILTWFLHPRLTCACKNCDQASQLLTCKNSVRAMQDCSQFCTYCIEINKCKHIVRLFLFFFFCKVQCKNLAYTIHKSCIFSYLFLALSLQQLLLKSYIGLALSLQCTLLWDLKHNNDLK